MEQKNDMIEEENEQSQGMESASNNSGTEDAQKIWKKNAPYLYDVLITWGLDWPSLCVDWLPKVDYVPKRNFYLQHLILGTNTSGEEPNFLLICKTRLPISKIVLDEHSAECSLQKDDIEFINKMSNEQMIEEYAKTEKKFEIVTKIPHEGEVNKAKASPKESNIMATQTNKGEIHIFDYFKCPPRPEDENVSKPIKRLISHTKIGYGLSWSEFKSEYLLSSSYDGSVCLWDINSNSTSPIHKYTEHKSEAEDVCFNKKQSFICGSVGDDKTIKIMDYREGKPVISVEGHTAEINSIDFNPKNEFLYLTGSSDKTVALWDLRKPDLKLHSFIHHKDVIYNVKWNSRRPNIFASSAYDNKILVWDLMQIGANIGREDNEDAPSEMIFEHGGHNERINDFSWNPNEDMFLASVDDNNCLEMWEMNINTIMNK